jgi:prepilin-type N-terminal cleavage/methylation domain-containing protein/prepilin-type processing-associated H-X9-DG protein
MNTDPLFQPAPEPRRTNHSHSRAFTLVELLVVVAVISILAALLLPTLSRAKSSAHLVKCINNERQIGLALTLYVSDHGVYPYQGLWRVNPPVRSFWAKLLQPYTNSEWTNGVFRCPSYRGLTMDPTSQGADQMWPDPVGSYGYNGFGSATVDSARLLGLGDFSLPDSPSWVKREIREHQVLVPSDMIAVADSANWLYYLPPPWRIRAGQLDASIAHNPGVNVAFCDAHVARLKLSDYLSDSDHDRRRWNNDHEPHPETWH